MGIDTSFRFQLRLVAVLICLMLAASCSKNLDNTTDSQAGAAQSAPAEESHPEGRVDLRSKPRQGPIDTARYTREEAMKQLLAMYQCSTNQCEFEVSAASTFEEATWLKARGFPTTVRSQQLEQMTLNELELASAKNDLAAKAILGRRLLEQGDETGGYTRLFEAATSGSVFADYQLSLATRNTNILESAAYLRRAYLQGDTKAAAVMYKTFPELNVVEWIKVDGRAMDLYRSVLIQRSRNGARLPYGPRP